MINSKEPYISIAIASYNYACYLERGFDAIVRQKYDDIEIVYCDDASQDDSVEVIRKIIAEHPKMCIRLICNETNRGIEYTKSRLIKECKGKYIMLCDADDWMADNCIRKLVEVAQKTDADHIIPEVYDIDEKGKIIQIQDFPTNPSKWLWNIHHGCLYRRSILIDNNIEIKGNPDDVYLITKFNQYCKKTEWIYEPLYFWYVHKDSAGRKKDKNVSVNSIAEEFVSVVTYIDETITYMKLHGGNDNDTLLLELLLIKIYYLYIYHVCKKLSCKGKLQCWRKMQKTMQKTHRDYLSNAYIFDKKSDVIRNYAKRIIRVSAALEKLSLLGPAIIGYHFLSYFIFFDQ